MYTVPSFIHSTTISIWQFCFHKVEKNAPVSLDETLKSQEIYNYVFFMKVLSCEQKRG